MKKISYLIITLILILIVIAGIYIHSKDQKMASVEKEAAILNRDGDRIEAKEKITTEEHDSLNKATENVVYEGITFKMSKKEYVAQLPRPTYTIGGDPYIFTPSFNKDGQLYLLSIRSAARNASTINTFLRNSMDNLKAVFVDKYGAPTYSNGYPDLGGLDPGITEWAYQWVIGTKRIYVGIAADPDAESYYAIASIFNEPMKTSVDENGNPALQKKDASKF